MILPAGRALTWQLTDQAGDPVVRERYWLTFTQSEDSADMQVIVESSTDLQNWQELALLQNRTTVRSDPSISITTSTTEPLRSRRLHAVTVRQLNSLDEKPSAYFRLRFEPNPGE